MSKEFVRYGVDTGFGRAADLAAGAAFAAGSLSSSSNSSAASPSGELFFTNR